MSPPTHDKATTTRKANREPHSVLFRSNYAMLGAVFAGAFGFQMAYDVTTTKVWDNMNRGRQWKDIKQKYLEGAEEEE